MKILNKYQCEFCHTEYADEADAEACERNHKSAMKIVGMRHLAKNQNGPGYPVTITVKMSDGRELTYKR